MRKTQYTKGVATIPIILAFGALIVAIGVGVSALSLTETLVSHGGYQSSRAGLYAEAGARDALMKVARNKAYTCATTDCYSIDMATSTDGCSGNSACAKVSVSSGAGTLGDPKVITSKGYSGIHTRTVRVSVILDSSGDGRIATSTWSDVTN